MTLRSVFHFCMALFAAGMLIALPNARAQQTPGPITPNPGTPAQQPPPGTIIVRVALREHCSSRGGGRKGSAHLWIWCRKIFMSLTMALRTRPSNRSTWAASIYLSSAVLVFETSARIAPLQPAIQKSAIFFTQTIVGPSGEAAVLTYDNSVDQLLALQHQ